MRIGFGLAILLLVARAEDSGPLAWKVPPDELVRYELVEIPADSNKKPGKGSVVTVQRHDLRVKGQYWPVSLARKDLPVLLAFRLPPPGAVKLKLKLTRTVTVRVKGMLQATVRSDGTAAVTGSYSFASKGSESKDDTHLIRSGRAKVDGVFDVKAHHFRSARVTVDYTLSKLNPKKKEKPKQVRKTFELTLQKRQPVQYKGQQDDINAAIERGMKHLKSIQKEDGDYKPHGQYTVGTTALGILTLSACGVLRDDPAITKGLTWIFTKTPTTNYSRAVALMAIEHVYTPPDEIHRKRVTEFKRELPDDRRAWCRRVAAALERDTIAPGSWAYKAHPGARYIVHPDTSNTQYAVLGLRAAARMGIPVKVQTWEGIVRYFGQMRERKAPRATVKIVREGEVQPTEHKVRAAAGFRYNVSKPYAWAAMTCAGIASLSIAREQLQGKKKLSPKLEKHIADLILGGWAWIDRHWAVDRHPRHPGNRWHFYYLYSLERAGILDGVKRVGGKDWYRQGATQLLARQKESGSWDDTEKEQITKTCFALLFLKRATAPVVLTR